MSWRVSFLEREWKSMRSGHQDPYRIYKVCGRQFPVYLESDKDSDDVYPLYPDFAQEPEYSAEGRPFSTSAQEACPYVQAQDRESPLHSPYDPIGICLCDARSQKPQSEEDR
jgi:hypothetical protein